MGCESGKCVLAGSYAPRYDTTPYLLAGSPFVVANLWNVTHEEGDTLIRAMFEGLVKQRSNGSERRIGFVMQDVRRNLPSMAGASTVCVGLPTTICRRGKRKNVESSNPNKRRKF